MSDALEMLRLCKMALPQLEVLRDTAPNEEARECWARGVASVMMAIEAALDGPEFDRE